MGRGTANLTTYNNAEQPVRYIVSDRDRAGTSVGSDRSTGDNASLSEKVARRPVNKGCSILLRLALFERSDIDAPKPVDVQYGVFCLFPGCVGEVCILSRFGSVLKWCDRGGPELNVTL